MLLGCKASDSQTNSDLDREMWTKYETECQHAGATSDAALDGVADVAHSKTVLRGIAVMGDSDSDEYRADDNRGGEYAATTFNWVEQLALRRGLNFGCWGTWPEPRRTGFEFNWARSGATAESLLSGGQHTGVASQVAAGKVTLVFLHVGSNDFLRGHYEEIYDGRLSERALDSKVVNFIANITTAIDTVLDAGPVSVVLTDVQDPSASPFVARKYPDAAGRQRVADAIAVVNTGLASMAAQRGAILVESNKIAEAGMSRISKTGKLSIGGKLVDVVNRGNSPLHFQLDDNAGHAGTIASGLLANVWFIEPVNAALGTSMEPFSDLEILKTAGVAP